MHLPVLSLKDDLNVGQVEDGINGYNFTDADSMYELLKKLRDMPKDELAEFHTRESIKQAADLNDPPLQDLVEKPVIIKSVPLNISPTPPKTLSPTRS